MSLKCLGIMACLGLYSAVSLAQTSSLVFPANINKELFSKIVAQGNVKQFTYLLQHLPSWDINVSYVDKKGNTVLHLLTQHGQAEMIALAEIMLDTKVNAQVTNNEGLSVMQLAEGCGDSKVCSLLRSLQGGGSWKSLIHAIEANEPEAVLTLLQANRYLEDKEIGSIIPSSDPDERKDKRLYLMERTIEKNFNEAYDFLVKNNFPHSFDHIDIALKYSNAHVIRYLFNNGYYGKKYIYEAIKGSSIDVVNTILDIGESKNDKFNYSKLLDVALQERRFNVAKILIERGAEVKEIEYGKWVELGINKREREHILTKLDHLSTEANKLSSLIEEDDLTGVRTYLANSKYDAAEMKKWKNSKGKLPVDIAEDTKHYAIVAVLLWAFEDINYYSFKSLHNFPLQYAVSSGNTELVAEMLEADAKAYVPYTLDAMYALGELKNPEKREELADILIPSLSAEEKNQALDSAKRHHHKWLEETLLMYGAEPDK